MIANGVAVAEEVAVGPPPPEFVLVRVGVGVRVLVGAGVLVADAVGVMLAVKV
jgi:hypothetical protein